MTEFPFQLLIKCRLPEERTESLTCTAFLRNIPGNRIVYEASWNAQEVIVKVFSHKISAKRRFEREWRALNRLQEKNLSSPAPLFYGKTENGSWALVMKKIADASTVLDVFNKTNGNGEKLNLLVMVCKELAKQHKKGVLQKDLHLGNFLLKGGEIFTVDATQMGFSSSEAGKNKSLSQLALLACNLPQIDTEFVTILYQEYACARNWSFDKSDIILFEKECFACRAKTIRIALKKSLRTSTRTLRVRAGRYRAVFDRGFYQGAEPLDFIKRIDTLMDAGQILKSANTSCVSRLTWNGKDVVVKRYNHKGFVHSLRHTIKRSRARRSWLHGHRLKMLNIATPAPLAYIEQRRWFFLWQSYLVTEYVQGQNLYIFLRDKNVHMEARSKVGEQLKALLAQLCKYRISHGDLKHTNILVTENGPILTDLDAMRVHRWSWTHKIRWSRDMKRFADIF